MNKILHFIFSPSLFIIAFIHLVELKRIAYFLWLWFGLGATFGLSQGLTLALHRESLLAGSGDYLSAGDSNPNRRHARQAHYPLYLKRMTKEKMSTGMTLPIPDLERITFRKNSTLRVES